MKKLLLIACILFTTISYAQTPDTSQIAVSIDQLISKYSPAITQGMEKVYEFTKVKGEQAIEVFYKYILFKDIFWVGIGTLALLIILILFIKAYRNYKRNDDRYSETPRLLLFFASLGLFIVGTTFLTMIYDLILLLMVPEIRLLQEIMSLINTGHI